MLVFLDIDGVMLPAASWKTPENLEDGFPMFSKRAVQALKSMLDDDSEIILTTSHKGRFTPAEWKVIFERRGVRIEKLSCLESNTDLSKRKDELVDWFESHSISENFVIIDDDSSLHALPRHLKDRWINTSSLVGLTPERVSEASILLNGN